MHSQPYAAASDDADWLTDRELLARFNAHRNEAAFEQLVLRHGAMVLRVCQRVLPRPEDAEDAFQATFMVLARKAGQISWQESVAGWLHEVAGRVARESRRGAARGGTRVVPAAARKPGDPLAEVSGRELVGILDQELAGLPAEFRDPLVLCCQEGLSGDEAARHLGCSLSTLKRRLHRGRELLHARLTRRGMALSAPAFAALLTAAAASAAVPLPGGWAGATAHAASVFATGGAPLGGVVSAKALFLARRLTPAVSAKVKLLLGVVAVGGLVVTGALVWPGQRGAVEPEPSPPVAFGPAAARPSGPPAAVARVETTLQTAGSQIRQFAFDGDPATFFASAAAPTPADHFTLVFDRPVVVKSVRVSTGQPGGVHTLVAGALEGSADGVTFRPLASFDRGAVAAAVGRELVAVRVRPTAAQPYPLVVRDVAVESVPAVAAFRHPVEFAVDASAAPDMAEWAERVTRVCEHHYPMICDELASPGYTPPTVIPVTLRPDSPWLVAATQGRITASVGYFRANPHDVGAVIHATSLVVQAYQGRRSPAWLAQGIADYVRFYKFEPGALPPADPVVTRYDADSRSTAAFLAYATAAHDPDLVRKLNAALREGRYTDDFWIAHTGRSLRALDEEWRRTLR